VISLHVVGGNLHANHIQSWAVPQENIKRAPRPDIFPHSASFTLDQQADAVPEQLEVS
jgi:hypothetical protein